MSGIYTQKRSLDVNVRGLSWLSPSGGTSTSPTVNQSSSGLIPGNQETTSFRSGVLGDRLEVESPDAHVYGDLGSLSRPSKGGLRDTGHNFYSRTEQFVSTSHPAFTFDSNYNLIAGYTRHFRGPIIHDLQPWQSVYPAINRLSLTGGEGTADMQRLLKMAVPTRANAGLNQMIGELTNDGLPSFANTISRKQGNLAFFGKGYVNAEFAWKPLVSDVTKLIKSLKKANTILRQFERDSGRPVRRRIALPETTVTTSFTTSPYSTNYGVEPLMNYGFYRTGHIMVEQKKFVQTWFAGAFTYYVPSDDSVWSRLQRYEQLGNKLLGTRLTVDILWELAPWSWLVDWVSTIGDSLSNAVAFQDDGLVMPWGYMMRKTRINTLATGTLKHKDISSLSLEVRNAFSVVQKERVQATPYGFGLSVEAFSLRQWAILAALGISRAPSRL